MRIVIGLVLMVAAIAGLHWEVRGSLTSTFHDGQVFAEIKAAEENGSVDHYRIGQLEERMKEAQTERRNIIALLIANLCTIMGFLAKALYDAKSRKSRSERKGD